MALKQELNLYLNDTDSHQTIRHVLGLAKMHRWIRTCPNSEVEHDLPNVINLAASLSAYFAIAFPVSDDESIKLGCQEAEADWLNLLAIKGVCIDASVNRMYLLIAGYKVNGQIVPPLAIGIHLNTKWKVVKFENFSWVDLVWIQLKKSKDNPYVTEVLEQKSDALQSRIKIFFSNPQDLLQRAVMVEQGTQPSETMASTIQKLI